MFSSGTTGTPKCMVHSVGVSTVRAPILYSTKVSLTHTLSQCPFYSRTTLCLVVVYMYLCPHPQGTLIQHLKEHLLHGNMNNSDVIFYYTTVSVARQVGSPRLPHMHATCSLLSSLPPAFSPLQTGWMMWNWLVSALAVGATLVLYDGSPFIPTPNVLWDCVDKFG